MMRYNHKLPYRVFLILFFWICGVVSLLAQQGTISGKITDKETGEGLPGATVVIEGTTEGTVTDVEGNYTLKLTVDNPKLIVSFVGYADQKTEVNGRAVVNVDMEMDMSELEEVIVVGYGTMKKQDMTGAVSSVKGEAFQAAQPVSIQNALAGRVAGVQITQTDNAPGAGVNIVVRGGSTITGGNQPLYVIDGFPIVADNDDPASNPLADISTNQIESFEILKDASATAIYGAQGANGVVIITTKLGKSGKPRINVDVNRGISVMDGYPDVFTPDEFAAQQLENIEDYRYSSVFYPSAGVEYWENPDAFGLSGKIWIEEITRKADVTNVNLDFNGGSDGMRYSISANYLNQEGIILNSGFERMNVNANFEQKLGESSRIGTSLKVSKIENFGLINTWEEGTIIKKALQSSPFIADDFSSLDVGAGGSDLNAWNNENIKNYVNNVDNRFETIRLMGNLFFEQEIIDGLKFYTSYGFNLSSKDETRFLPIDTRRGSVIGGSADFRERDHQRYVYQARLGYNKVIAEHSFGATAVFETTKEAGSTFETGVQGFEDDSRGIYDLSSSTNFLKPSNYHWEKGLISYLGRFNYSFDGKYLLTASLRADGSSLFGANNKFGYFPSLALGWVVSDENFMESIQFFDLFKIRASYGVTGNNQIDAYSKLAQLQTQSYVLNGELVAGAVPSTMVNNDLRWENTTQYNLGLDLGFIKSRLMITGEVYYKETTDMLLQVLLPPTSGFQQAVINVGSMSNKGIELAINSVNVERKNFKWTSAFTFSANRGKVLSLGDTDQMFFTRGFYSKVTDDILLREGEQIGIYYGYIEDGINNSYNEIDNSPSMQAGLESVPGMTKFYDVNGDGVVNQSDKVPLAKTVPDFIGGLNNQLNYRNFDLNFFFRWSYGNDVVNGNITFLDRVVSGFWNTMPSYADYAYSPRNPDGTVHGLVTDTYAGFMRSGYIEDGSFLKLDYITLGYTFNESLMSKVGVRKFRIYARVTNPLMFTRYSWFDPEVSTGYGVPARIGPGVDVGTYPRAKTYTIGLSLGL